MLSVIRPSRNSHQQIRNHIRKWPLTITAFDGYVCQLYNVSLFITLLITCLTYFDEIVRFDEIGQGTILFHLDPFFLGLVCFVCVFFHRLLPAWLNCFPLLNLRISGVLCLLGGSFRRYYHTITSTLYCVVYICTIYPVKVIVQIGRVKG